MSKIVEKLFPIAEPFAQSLGLELVDIEFVKEGGQLVLRFLIDKEGGVTLDDCEAFSRLLDPELDRLDPIDSSYLLQVSSPGIERPLKKESDYERFRGKLVKVKLYKALEGQKSYKGILHGLDDKRQVLLETKKQEIIQIPLELVAKAHLAMD